MKKSDQEPLVLIEVKLNYTHIAPSGFGTVILPIMLSLRNEFTI